MGGNPGEGGGGEPWHFARYFLWGEMCLYRDKHITAESFNSTLFTSVMHWRVSWWRFVAVLGGGGGVFFLSVFFLSVFFLFSLCLFSLCLFSLCLFLVLLFMCCLLGPNFGHSSTNSYGRFLLYIMICFVFIPLRFYLFINLIVWKSFIWLFMHSFSFSKNWLFLSVCLSVSLSVCLSFCLFHSCSHSLYM